MMKLAVISGKGGTGKTSVTAALATLAGQVALADCDVDAPDLHLLIEPQIQQQGSFVGGKRATIDPATCCACGRCASACRFEAISLTGPGNGGVNATYRIDPLACEGCGACALACPASAIRLDEAACGEWYDSETRFGPMAHARLHPGHENSGKLVTLVRRRAEQLAKQRSIPLVLIDGAPGIGCPVIASITGCDLLLAVTELSASALHDLDRVLDLADQLRVPALICVNRCNGGSPLGAQVDAIAAAHNAPVAGRLRYDRAVVHAQFRRQSVVEYGNTGIAEDIRGLWRQLCTRLALNGNNQGTEAR